MKYIYSTLLLAAALLIGSANVQAQKRVSLGEGKNAAATLLAPDNAKTKVINEHQTLVSFGDEQKNVRHEGRATHNFSINIAGGDWQEIHVASGDDYMRDVYIWEGGGYNEVVEEGYYDIFIVGFSENGGMCYLTYDQVPVFEDVDFDATFSDCIYTCGQHALDQDGNDLANLDYVSNDYMIYFSWLNGKRAAANQMMWYPEYFTEFPMHFSSCDERSGLMLVENLHTAEQVAYNITTPYTFGISDNVILGNDFEKLTGHAERYYVDDSETSYYHNDFITFFGENSYIGIFSWTVELTLDAHQPIMIYSDTKTDNPNDFSNGAITLDLPAVYENYHSNTYPYENKIAPFGFYHNGDGKLVREPFGKTRDDFNYMVPSYLDWLPLTPVTTYTDPDETLYFGERTPMIYNQPYVVKPEYSWSGNYGIQVHILPIGENGCMRYGDMDASFLLSVDGEEAFNDTLKNWQSWDELQIETPCYVDFEIRCNHLTVDGTEKSNYTFMEIDLSSDDVNAPSMTFLQVKDANNRECVELTDLEHSTICFAAGDFSPHYTEEGGYGHFDYMQYDGKPELGVSYSLGNGDWTDMEFKEEGSLFHENYGNVFTVDLAQIPDNVSDTWVSVQFIFIDDAGNVQQQILSNLFYVGELTNVSESTAATSIVYPNPFSGEVRINAAEAVNGNANISVFNVLGEQVISRVMQCNGTTEFVIDGSGLNAGIYFYSIATENGKLQGRIVKE